MHYFGPVLNQICKRLGLFLISAVTFGALFGLGISLMRIYDDSVRDRERSSLVVSIVREQLEGLKSEVESNLFRNSENSSELQSRRWVIEKLLENLSDPSKAEVALETMTRRGAGEINRESIRRWESGLKQWASESDLNTQSLLSEGREHYFEALGYRKIGRPADGIVLNLWTIVALTNFIEKSAPRPRMPELLFMLGDSYLSLGKSLANRSKSDRILNLCSELYPDSVWASRANSVWKEEFNAI